jgi:hypothetical protein
LQIAIDDLGRLERIRERRPGLVIERVEMILNAEVNLESGSDEMLGLRLSVKVGILELNMTEMRRLKSAVETCIVIPGIHYTKV